MADDYHTKAQKFIKSSKGLGYKVKAEGGELIATPPKATKTTLGAKIKKGIKNIVNSFPNEAKLNKAKDDNYRREATYGVPYTGGSKRRSSSDGYMAR